MDLMTKKDVAELINSSTKTVDRLWRLGKLPFVRLPSSSGAGRRAGGLRFLREDVEGWILSHRVMTGA